MPNLHQWRPSQQLNLVGYCTYGDTRNNHHDTFCLGVVTQHCKQDLQNCHHLGVKVWQAAQKIGCWSVVLVSAGLPSLRIKALCDHFKYGVHDRLQLRWNKMKTWKFTGTFVQNLVKNLPGIMLILSRKWSFFFFNLSETYEFNTINVN